MMDIFNKIFLNLATILSLSYACHSMSLCVTSTSLYVLMLHLLRKINSKFPEVRKNCKLENREHFIDIYLCIVTLSTPRCFVLLCLFSVVFEN